MGWVGRGKAFSTLFVKEQESLRDLAEIAGLYAGKHIIRICSGVIWPHRACGWIEHVASYAPGQPPHDMTGAGNCMRVDMIIRTDLESHQDRDWLEICGHRSQRHHRPENDGGVVPTLRGCGSVQSHPEGPPFSAEGVRGFF